MWQSRSVCYIRCNARYTVFFLMTVLVTVVLLNSLIAVISETFDRLQEHSEANWTRGQAHLIFELELILGECPVPTSAEEDA